MTVIHIVNTNYKSGLFVMVVSIGNGLLTRQTLLNCCFSGANAGLLTLVIAAIGFLSLMSMREIQPLKAPPYLSPHEHKYENDFNPDDVVNIAMVVCRNRQTEALTLVKSAVIFTPTNLHIHAVVEAKLWKAFNNTVLLLRY